MDIFETKNNKYNKCTNGGNIYWKAICLTIVLAFMSLVIYQDNVIAANKTTSKELPSDFAEQVEMMGYGNKCLNYINRTYGTNKTIKTYIDKMLKNI